MARHRQPKSIRKLWAEFNQSLQPEVFVISSDGPAGRVSQPEVRVVTSVLTTWLKGAWKSATSTASQTNAIHGRLKDLKQSPTAFKRYIYAPDLRIDSEISNRKSDMRTKTSQINQKEEQFRFNLLTAFKKMLDIRRFIIFTIPFPFPNKCYLGHLFKGYFKIRRYVKWYLESTDYKSYLTIG